MKFSLKNKTAIVTGGASGIGKAITEAFVAQGAKVHLLEMNYDLAKSLVSKINDEGGQASAHQCNVADQEQVNAVIKQIASRRPR